ncbi:MAG: 50S rRNA methyltransferase [Gammaproteobacteria bacterium]|nr:MAG: 50S rRNA methyltransferase [Gammaproteobacteria bacterium]
MDKHDTLRTGFGEFQLDRLPATPDGALRAWNAADELLLEQLQTQGLPRADERVLVVNDEFGALACALHAYKVQSWSDSLLAHLATAHNFRRNQLDEQALPALVRSTAQPEGRIDIALLKVPKTLALLQQQLQQLKPLLHADSVVIAAAMTKHLPGAAIQCFEDTIGRTHTSLAKKKARLIFSQVEPRAVAAVPAARFEVPDLQLSLTAQANVFSKDKLDIGARFMLAQFARLPEASRVIDLGCGNGVLGIVAQRQLPHAELHFVDESYMAVASAQDNYQAAFPQRSSDQRAPGQPQAQFWNSNGLQQVAVDDVDLILCNPPFHQQHSTGDQIAWQMLKQGRRALCRGGQFWLVGNRHLGYHTKMKKLFGNCTTIAAERKFVVLSATA